MLKTLIGLIVICLIGFGSYTFSQQGGLSLGGAPSQAAIQTAYKAHIAKFYRKPFDLTISGQNCRELSDRPGYVCTFQVSWSDGSTSSEQFRFYQQGREWVLTAPNA